MIDHINDFDDEGGGAGGDVEDLDEGFCGIDSPLFTRLVREGRELEAGVLFDYLAPCDGGRKAVRKTELGLQQLVNAADYVGDDLSRGIENAALDAQLRIIGLQKVLIEADDGILIRVLIAKIAQDFG